MTAKPVRVAMIAAARRTTPSAPTPHEPSTLPSAINQTPGQPYQTIPAKVMHPW